MEGSYASLKSQKSTPFELEIELFNTSQLLGWSTAIVGGAFSIHYYLQGLYDLVFIFGACASLGGVFCMMKEKVIFNNKQQCVQWIASFLFRIKILPLYYSKINSIIFVPFGELHTTAGIFLKLYDGKKLFVVLGESEEIRSLGRKISEFIGKEFEVLSERERDEREAA